MASQYTGDTRHAAAARRLTKAAVVAIAAFSAGCGGDRGNPAVAQVGDKTITADDLRRFIGRLPAAAPGTDTKPGGELEHLQTLVDMELLVMEARSAGIDTNPEFIDRMRTVSEEKLVSLYLERELDAEVTEAEVAEHISREGLTRAIRFSDVLVDREEQAQEALRELARGMAFEDVARKWSMNAETSGRGGDLGRYSSKEELIPVLQEKLFPLAAGEVVGPIRIGDRYAIFKVAADTTIDLTLEKRMRVTNGIKQAKYDREAKALVDRLKTRFHLELEREGVDTLVAHLHRGATFVAEPERSTTLYRYDDGKIAAEQLVAVARTMKGDVLAGLTDASRVVSFAESRVVPRALFLEAALRAKIDEDQETVDWLADQTRELMVRELRARVLRGRVSIAGNEVRAFYDAHPERYMQPEQIQLQEVLVRSETEALRILKEIQRGVPIGDLAGKHSTRPTDIRDEQGRFHVHMFEASRFGGLVEAAEKARTGELIGPVRVAEGYSVFTVLGRERSRESFSEASWRVRSHVMREKSRKAFDEYLGELRAKYESSVTIREGNLKAAFGTG